jgi:hypothetical protein
VRITSDADKGTGRPVFIIFLRWGIFCIDRRSTGFRTYIAIPSFSLHSWSDNTQWRRLFLLLSDFLWHPMVFFLLACFEFLCHIILSVMHCLYIVFEYWTWSFVFA